MFSENHGIKLEITIEISLEYWKILETKEYIYK